MKDLSKEIKINVKFIVILMLVCIVSLGLYYSYALFQINVIKNNVIVLETGTVDLTMEVVGEENNTFTIPANGTKTVTVNLNSTAASPIMYKMYYTFPEGANLFTATSTTSFTNDIVEGEMTTSKQIVFTFQNNNATSIKLTLGAQGGLVGYQITLEQGAPLILNTPISITGPSAMKTAIANAPTTCKTNVQEDGITYISGTADCINFNYVWYSGKMWRITAIYPDGKMKLVTDNMITSISFNEDGDVAYYDKTNGTKSYMFQWLNEDFLDTLYNYENIIVHDSNTYWNATMPSDTNISTKPAETDATMIPTSISPVGLLNSYEYYLSYKNTTYSNGYLNIGYYWWLLNPYDSSDVRLVHGDGDGYDASPAYAEGVRPSIILQSNISLTESGIKTDPYKIVGDMSSPTLGTTKVNQRVFEKNSTTYSYNGEYVKIKYQENNEDTLSSLYRIVGVEVDPNDSSKTITKLVAMDYADNTATKKFATSSAGTTYGSGTTVDSGKTTWYSYLNGTGNNDGWFDNLGYKSLLTSGTYYMGNGDEAPNYKDAICATADITGLTRTCTKTSNTGTFNVGLLRYGEMFATQQKTTTNTSSQYIWLITKFGSDSVHYVSNRGDGNFAGPTYYTFGVRSSIYLSSDVKFLTCSSSKCDGTEDYPYEVGL